MSEEVKVGQEDPELLRRRHTNRRRMAWVSLAMMIFMTIALFFYLEIAKIQVLAEVVSWAYFAFVSIIGAYMGFTTWSGKK